MNDDYILNVLREKLSNIRKDINVVEYEYIEKIQSEIGFMFPNILSRLYTEVSDGYFGPGVLGIKNGMKDFEGKNAFEIYNELINVPGNVYSWDVKLFPIKYWGDAIYSSIYLEGEFPIVRSDPNYSPDELPYHLINKFSINNDVFGCSWIESISVDVWFNDWISGVDLFENAYSFC